MRPGEGAAFEELDGHGENPIRLILTGAPMHGSDDEVKRPLAIGDYVRKPRHAVELHDGLTAEQCLERMRARMGAADGLLDPAEIPGWPAGRSVAQELENGRLALTTIQIAAARDLWSAQLRARVTASEASERTQVVVDMQDEANC
jgi:hypothetical protein